MDIVPKNISQDKSEVEDSKNESVYIQSLRSIPMYMVWRPDPLCISSLFIHKEISYEG